MRIISKFKDYYDGVGASDLDPVPVYERHTIEVKEPNLFPKVGYSSFSQISIANHYTHNNIETRIKTGVIGFCGGIYPYMYKERFNSDDVSIGFLFEYDIKKFYDMLYPPTIKPGVLGPDRHKRLLNWLEHIKILQYMFKKYNVPVFRMAGYFDKKIQVGGIKENLKFELNPRLGDFGFYKVEGKDSYTAYQDIRVYLGNDLAKDTEVEVPVGGDLIVAHSKGFNKYSFRKDPGGKKRKKINDTLENPTER